ncbi:MAG: hypothetical protein SGJ26_02335 [Nitrospirota bacterium]|nr:hypothetical protein [Nitrospirota bacterium]
MLKQSTSAEHVGWARFNFTVPLPKSPLPTLQRYLPSMAKLIGPFFVFTFLAVFIALRQVRAARS